MDGEAAALGDRANRVEEVLVRRRARLDVHHHVGRDDLLDVALDRVACRVRLFEAGLARHADRHIDEIALARAAHAHAFGAQHALGLVNRARDAVVQAARRHIEQRVDRALAEPRSDPDDHARDAERGHRVHHAEPRNAEFLAEPCAGDAEHDDERAPHVRRKMQRVRLERFARIFVRYAAQRPRADEVDSHRQSENHDDAEAQPNRRCAEEQPLKRLPDDVERGEQQQARLDERREAFHFAVAVEVLRVGGLVRHAHRKIGDHRRDKIENRMQRFRKNSQAAGDNRQDHFQRDEHQRRRHRPERRHLFLARCSRVQLCACRRSRARRSRPSGLLRRLRARFSFRSLCGHSRDYTRRGC